MPFIGREKDVNKLGGTFNTDIHYVFLLYSKQSVR